MNLPNRNCDSEHKHSQSSNKTKVVIIIIFCAIGLFSLVGIGYKAGYLNFLKSTDKKVVKPTETSEDAKKNDEIKPIETKPLSTEDTRKIENEDPNKEVGKHGGRIPPPQEPPPIDTGGNEKKADK